MLECLLVIKTKDTLHTKYSLLWFGCIGWWYVFDGSTPIVRCRKRQGEWLWGDWSCLVKDEVRFLVLKREHKLPSLPCSLPLSLSSPSLLLSPSSSHHHQSQSPYHNQQHHHLCHHHRNHLTIKIIIIIITHHLDRFHKQLEKNVYCLKRFGFENLNCLANSFSRNIPGFQSSITWIKWFVLQKEHTMITFKGYRIFNTYIA